MLFDPHFWIPACAGMMGMDWAHRHCGLDSGLRRNDGGWAAGMTAVGAAAMTGGWACPGDIRLLRCMAELVGRLCALRE